EIEPPSRGDDAQPALRARFHARRGYAPNAVAATTRAAGRSPWRCTANRVASRPTRERRMRIYFGLGFGVALACAACGGDDDTAGTTATTAAATTTAG